MTDPVFVGREEEIARLQGYLERTLAGQGQIVFVAGEAGMGKTALLRRFSAAAQQRHGNLIAAVGDCNAQTGSGEAYLPFREVLALLTGNLEAKLAEGAISDENAGRLKKLFARSALLFLEVAPDLIEFIPGGKIVTTAASLATTVGKAMGKQAHLEDRLQEMAEHAPEKTELARSTVEQAQIFEQCTRFLRRLAAEQPLLVVLEDLHWADASSLDLLFHLGRRLADAPLLLAGSYRPADLKAGREGERHPLEKVQAELKRYYGDIVLELAPGGEEDARHFVDAYVDQEPNLFTSEFRAALAAQTRGNPLFLVELLRSMQARGDVVKNERGKWVAGPGLDWELMPARVEGVIEERVERLEKTQRQTLTLASVEGEEFTAEVVAHLQQAPARELVRRLSGELSKEHRLVQPAGLLRLSRQRLSRYRFSHNLIQRYLYGRLDEIELAYLHEDVGAALEELYAGELDDVAVQLAWHFERAGVHERAASYHRRAGEQAARRHAHTEALYHLGRALEWTPLEEIETRYALLLTRETVLGWQGRRAEQRADLETLAGLAAALQEESALAEIALRRADLARLTGDYEAGLQAVQEAVRRAGNVGDGRREAAAYALWGRILTRTGAFDEAREWLHLALDLAREGGDDWLAADILWALGNCLYAADRLEEAASRFEKALAAFQAVGNRRGHANALLMLGICEARAGHFSAARDHLYEALAQCRALGWRYGECNILASLGNTYVDTGDYDGAHTLLSQALAIAQEIDDREGEAIYLDALGLIHHFNGHPQEAETLLMQALSRQRALGDRRSLGYALTHLGYVLAAGGEYRRAEEAFNEAVAIRHQLDAENGAIADDLAGLAWVRWRQSDTKEAATLAQSALARLETAGVAAVEYPLLVYLNCYQALQAAGEPERAGRALRAGYDLLQEQAGQIEEEELRVQFLNAVPFHRQLLAAWETKPRP